MTLAQPQFRPVPKEVLAELGTDPIPAAPYYDPEWFEREREAIFKRSWIQIGHLCELPEAGSFIVRPFEVARTSLLVTRTAEGRVRAFHNLCTHRGTRLVEEPEGRRNRFTCPYHGWTFGNDGSLLAAPDFDNFFVDRAACRLPEVACDVAGGFIFVNLDPEPAQGLAEYLGPLAEALERLPHARATAFAEYTYEVAANWKLTYDNFQENYHLRFIHPRSGEAAAGPDNPFGYPERYEFFGPHRTQRIWSNPAPAIKPFQGFAFGLGARFQAERGFDPVEKTYYGIFPNLFLFGSPMTPFSQWVMPLAADRTRSVIRIYWTGEAACASELFAREYALVTTLDIHSEDRAVIEAGHAGLASGALPHIHFQAQEVLCRHFFQQVAARVENDRKGSRGGAR